MRRKPDVARAQALVLIPAHNEVAQIRRVVEGCRVLGFTVWVLDDGSTDGTGQKARRAGAQVLSRGRACGKTAMLRFALQRLPEKTEWLFLLDGDGQHDPADLERFWCARRSADLIVGNRFPSAHRMPWLRRWTNRAMSRGLRQFYGSKVLDTQCGLRLVRRVWLGTWLPQGNRYEFETELSLRTARRKTRVVNLPIAAIYAGEKSKIAPLRDAWHFFRCLWRAH